ncbi:hypothetical protein QL285_045156 [Trifolium repens]|nr:hypothetical protein QL285_045156 [Trifolium repens]
MAGNGNDSTGENHPNVNIGPNHQEDGHFTAVTPTEASAGPTIQPQEEPLNVPPLAVGTLMEEMMATLINVINRQGTIIRDQNRRLAAVEESRATRSSHPRRSPQHSLRRRDRSVSRSRSPRRLSPRRNRRSPSPRRNAAVHVRTEGGRARRHRSPPKSSERYRRHRTPESDEEKYLGPLSERIMRVPLPPGLEKLPVMDTYDGSTDPDDHLENIEAVLEWRRVRGAIKCKIFSTTLRKGALTWYKGLPPQSINSWTELCRQFTAHFTASRKHPLTVSALEAIVQRDDEPLRDYIDGFNKIAVQVRVEDKMKLYLMDRGLRANSDFAKAVGIEEIRTLDTFLEKAQKYIAYEEKQMAVDARKPRHQDESGPSKRGTGNGKEKVREPKAPPSKFTNYTPLNAPRERILAEVSAAEFKKHGIRFPKQIPAKPGVDKGKYCRFHRSYGHVTEDCVHLKDAIEILIQQNLLQKYRKDRPRENNDRRQEVEDPPAEEETRASLPVAYAITRPEDFTQGEEVLAHLTSHLNGSWENFPKTLVISGGGFNNTTLGTIKRKFEELESVCSLNPVSVAEIKEGSIPLAFYKEEIPGGSPNFQIPLLVQARMANFDVRRILVDQGSSCDIVYSGLFKTLQITEKNLKPYVGADLQGFNGATTKPWGYTDLIVTFGEGEATKSINVQFLVVECPSLYNCIIGRTTLADLFAVSSTIHLKMKYYTVDRKVATLNGDIAAARRCSDAAAKNMNTLATPKKMKTEHKMPAINAVGGQGIVELDARTSKKERREEKKELQKELKEIFRPIPDGEFEIIPLGEDPSKGIKIGADLPDLVKRQLEACLKENAELFAWSAAEMPDIDPKVACHQLTIDPKARAIAQRRRKQSPEKAEAAEKAVKDLLEANFISEAKYTTWLSNVVLVKKSNGKWRMCVDYTDLNRACPKDGYHLPIIDKLVDNSSGFKLLSFMDAYSGYNQIKMAEIDKKKTAFMTESGNYYYNVMPFGLINAGATYQRMMNSVFRNQIGDMLEVYMDDMIVKS